MKVLMVFILGFASVDGTLANSVSADHKISKEHNRLTINDFDQLTLKEDSVIFSGRVLDASTGEELPGATIVIKETTIGTSTDLNGNFELSVPENKLGKKAYLVISSVGFATQELKIESSNTSQLTIELEIDSFELGEIRIPWYKQIWWTLTSPFRNG